MNHKLSQTSWKYIPGFILILYAALSFYQINLPGLHYDEAFEVVPAMQLLLGQPTTAFRDSAITIGQFSFPLMTQDYIGALNTYMAIPFIAAFGSTTTALRTMSIVTGGITLVLTNALAYRLSGQRWVGVSAMLLLSVDPTFIFWNRQGVFVTAITASIGLAATYCWLRRFKNGGPAWSIAGAFFFGAGIYAKFLFLWLIAALVGAVLLLNLDRLLSSHRTNWINLTKRVSIVEIISASGAFFAGCSLLIAYNLQTWGTFLSIAQNASTSYYGVDNSAFAVNLVERVQQFFFVLNGSHLWYLGEIVKNRWVSPIFGLCIFLIVLLAIRNLLTGKSVDQSKIALFCPFVMGLVILASIRTVSALWITHFAILMPWPALAFAVGSWFIVDNISSQPVKPYARLLLVMGLSIMVITNLSSTFRYHAVLTESGGLSSHSDAVYDLSDWLAQRADGSVIAMDWGLAAPVMYLTHGQVAATEIFGYGWQSDNQLTERLQWSLGQPDTLYLWRSPDEVIFDRSAEFKALYQTRNLEETIEEAFYEKSGRPILGVTRLVQQGTASNPP